MDTNILHYTIYENGCYIPIHLNSIVNVKDERKPSLKINYLTKEILDAVAEIYSQHSHNYYVLDFHRITSKHQLHTESKAAKKLIECIKSDDNDKPIYLINCREDAGIKRYFINNANGHLVEHDELLLGNDEKESMYTKLCYHVTDGNRQSMTTVELDGFINRQIKEVIERSMQHVCVDDNIRKQHSANLYVNRYINIKPIFDDFPIFALTIYQLARIIHKEFRDEKGNLKFDHLVCSSRTGAAIATILSLLLEVKCAYLISVGPRMNLKDRDAFVGIEENRRYLYIFDFISTGSEYKITEAILTSKNALLVGGAGYSMHLHPYRFEDSERQANAEIHVLADMNKLLKEHQPYMLCSENIFSKQNSLVKKNSHGG